MLAQNVSPKTLAREGATSHSADGGQNVVTLMINREKINFGGYKTEKPSFAKLTTD